VSTVVVSTISTLDAQPQLSELLDQRAAIQINQSINRRRAVPWRIPGKCLS
jgi:hypothetical protein